MNTANDTDLSGFVLDDLLAMLDDETTEVGAVAAPQAVSKRIAIIGMAGKIAGSDDLQAFWQTLYEGRMTRRKLPHARSSDLEEFLRLKGAQSSGHPVEYFRLSFLNEVDKFDHRFFGIAKQEANLIDPAQRLFLETAWTACEDAGYSGKSIQGSKTGVFVGHSGDFGNSYRDIVHTLAPDAPEVAVVGNVRSIIASRIAYHLDLHGPSMMVDTACSSGLVALHLACRALQNGDCEMAIAGTVKVDLVPVVHERENRVGIRAIAATMASDGRTRSFDDGGEGTAGAEGVIAFLLKPLDKALADGDHIHGVVLGSAVNQDGHSVGITAPNLAAQESLIVAALKDAAIRPETISYIEAHGTATRLGDPIEISGIQRAFRQFTERRQFCAIGSVKSNIGHMDNGAGLAGLAKVVLSMQHQQLPATLNFNRPNRNINFENSPVYVNDRRRPWLANTDDPLRAGINSFGLSGTNCHVLVESAPYRPPQPAQQSGPWLLLISARTELALERLTQDYQQLLQNFAGRAQDLCFTAAMGRQHHNHRLAILFDDVPHLRQQLQQLLASGMQNGLRASIPGIAFGIARTVNDKRAPVKEPGELTESERRQLDHQAQILSERFARATQDARAPLWQEAAALYAQGADMPWEHWFEGQHSCRIPLPTYPFAPTRCWVETTELGERAASRSSGKPIRHPLLDRLAASAPGWRMYQAMLGVESHWELADHKVKGMYVLPGTALLEMILATSAHMSKSAFAPLQLEQLVFLQPFMLADQQRKALHLMLEDSADGYKLQIASRPDADGDDWDIHAEGTLKLRPAAPRGNIDLAALQARLPQPLGLHRNEAAYRGGLAVGDRWNLSFQQGWGNQADDEFLIHIALPEAYRAEVPLYLFHPALLDTAVNAVNHLSGDGGLYLPFSYKRLEVFKPLGGEFYVHLKRKDSATAQAFHLDINLINLAGEVCAHAHEYAVKRVPTTELIGEHLETHMHYVHLTPWKGEPGAQAELDGPILLVRDQHHADLANALRTSGAEVLELVRGSAPVSAQCMAGGTDAAGFERALQSLEGQRLGGVIYACALGAQWPVPGTPESTELAADPASLLHDFTDFVAAWGKAKLRTGGNLLVLTCGGFTVEDHAVPVQPQQAAVAALSRIVRIENPQQRWRCVDCDSLPTGALLLREVLEANQKNLSVYRLGVLYRERLDSVPRLERVHFTPRHEGVYLITGGFGALGLELALHMARRGNLNLALISSTPLPLRDEWEAILSSGQAPEKTLFCIRHLLHLSELGAHVECIAADVSNATRMAEVLDQLRSSFGRINGIVHAAGRGGEGFLQNKSRAKFDSVIAPKIDGTKLLHELTLRDPLDFFIMYSSITTVIHVPGQTDYTAANTYMNAMAHFRRNLGLPAISICWPAWREVGMALEFGAVNEEEFLSPIENAIALELTEQVLCDDSELPPVLILSKINPRAKLEQIDALGLELPEAMRKKLRRGSGTAETASPGTPASGAAADEVQLQGIANPDAIALAVAHIWSRVLGTHEFGADEGFAEHGGNSILTTQMYREFERLYPGVLDVVDLFTHTTIREQADFLRDKLGVPVAASPAAVEVTTIAAATVDVLQASAAAAQAADAKPAESAEQRMDRILSMLAAGELSPEDAEAMLMD